MKEIKTNLAGEKIALLLFVAVVFLVVVGVSKGSLTALIERFVEPPYRVVR